MIPNPHGKFRPEQGLIHQAQDGRKGLKGGELFAFPRHRGLQKPDDSSSTAPKTPKAPIKFPSEPSKGEYDSFSTRGANQPTKHAPNPTDIHFAFLVQHPQRAHREQAAGSLFFRAFMVVVPYLPRKRAQKRSRANWPCLGLPVSQMEETKSLRRFLTMVSKFRLV